MEAEKQYESVRFYIIEASRIKGELAKHETEYHPEKVRSLIASYKYTLQTVSYTHLTLPTICSV